MRENQEFAGLCPAFPSLLWFDKDLNAALRGIMALVADYLNGESQDAADIS